MITNEILNAISDDFESTFSQVDSNTLANLMYEYETERIETIIRKHLKNVRVEFHRTNQLSKDPNGKDVWLIRIYPNS